MTPVEVVGKIARGDVYVVNRHVSGRADGRRDGGDLRSARLRPGGGVRAGGAERRARSARSIRAAHDLEGYLFPETYALPRHTERRGSSRLMVELQACLHAEMRAAAEARGLTCARRSRWPRSSKRKRRGPTSVRSWPPCTRRAAHRHAAAVRSDGDLRARAGRPVRRQHPQGRSVVRFAVQHVSLSGPAARPDCVARQGVARSGASIRPTPTISTSSAATTARTSSRERSRSTTATSRSFRSSTFATKRLHHR